MLVTTFMFYDDEGYVLWSIRSVNSGHALYSEVYSQYGPFFYTLHGLGAKLGLPSNNDSARFVAALLWVAISALNGRVAFVLTRSHAWALFALITTFLSLTSMRSEPGHPGGMLAFLTALGAWLGTEHIRNNRVLHFAWTQGALAGAMLLTKLNVGVFHAIASVSWWPFRYPVAVSEFSRRVLFLCASVVAAGLLMSAFLSEFEIQSYFAVFVLSVIGLLLVRPAPHVDLSPHGFFGRFSAGVALIASVTVVWVVAGGTSIADLGYHALIAPAQHPGNYHFFRARPPWTLALALLATAAALFWLLGSLRLRRHLLGVTRLSAGALLCAGLLQADQGSIESMLFLCLPPFAWAFALSDCETSPANTQARWWLAWMACWHWLQAYPVAGSQIAWGSFLFIPLCVAALHDTLNQKPGARLVRLTALALAAGIAAKFGGLATDLWRQGENLGLPGARTIRTEPRFSAQLRTISRNARAYAPQLFSYPGMLSFHGWTNVPPPTMANATHWFSLLDTARQEEIAKALDTIPGTLIITSPQHLSYLIRQGIGPAGPLKDHIHELYHPLLRLEFLDLWVRRGQHPGLVGVGRLLEIDGARHLILLTTAPLDEVTHLRVRDLAAPSNPLPVIPRGPGWVEHIQPAPLQPLRTDAEPGPVRRIVIPWDPSESPSLSIVNELGIYDKNNRLLDRILIDNSPVLATAFIGEPQLRSD
jgi:hypothetical protein